jgi:hypothetical protein
LPHAVKLPSLLAAWLSAGSVLAQVPAQPPIASDTAPAATEAPTAPVQAAPVQAAPVQAAPVQAAPVQAAPVEPIAESTAGALPPTTQAGDAAEFYGPGSAEVSSEAEAANSYPKLELSGFTDFSYIQNISPKSSALRKIAYPYSSFSVGNVNLYLAAALAERWKLLAEVRFLYLPSGALNYPNTAGVEVAPYDTSAIDYADDGRLLNWGGISIQRVQIDYALHPLLSFRFGEWLTPVGIWNVDHGSPVVISVFRPFIIGQRLFPERQTGIQISGEWSGEVDTLGYFLTLSNGRGPSDSYADLDNNKGVGGRAYWTTSRFGSLTLGVSAYKGRFTSRSKEYGITTPAGQAPVLTAVDPVLVSYHEQAIAADLRFEYSGLLVQSEVMQQEVAYEDGARPTFNVSPLADYRDRGYYALAGYRTPWLGIMPFGLVEGYNFAVTPYTGPGFSLSYGLNIRPQPNVVVKLQLRQSWLGTDDSPQPYRGRLDRILAQLAVAF